VKRTLTALLLAATAFLTLTAEGCETPADKAVPINYDNGEHEYQATGNGRFVYGNTLRPYLPGIACKWEVWRKNSTEKKRTLVRTGGRLDKVTVAKPVDPDTRVWLISKNCGKFVVKK
jgi:hypothetical protein